MSTTTTHNARVVPDIRRAIAEPAKWCISGRCPDTNWGGKDRLHTRQDGCPEFRKAELRSYLQQAGADPDAYVPKVGDTVASIIAPAERYGRVVGIMKRGRRDRRIIVREFVDGDTWFPTGRERGTHDGNLAPWPESGAQ